MIAGRKQVDVTRVRIADEGPRLYEMDRAACPRCRRELGEGEPVHQVYLGLRVCAKCLKESEGRRPYPSSLWRSAKPCNNCGRPVFNMAKGKEPEIIACGFRCRDTIHSAREITVASRPCAVCGKPFMPKQCNSRYCSASCRWRAYRSK